LRLKTTLKQEEFSELCSESTNHFMKKNLANFAQNLATFAVKNNPETKEFSELCG
jgi:hypothetical protein